MINDKQPGATHNFGKGIEINKIGFDFDGVIADTAEAFLRIACEQYGYCSFTQEDITNFDLEDCIEIPQNTVETIFLKIMEDSVGAALKPIHGAIKTLSEFSDHSNITIITARTTVEPVFDWFDLYIDRAVREKITIVATGDHDDKVRYIHNHGIRYFIDDRAATCNQLTQEDIIPIVFEQPWNRNRHNLHTVSGWQEIYDLVFCMDKN